MVQNPINNMYPYKPCNNKDNINDDHRTKGISFLALVFFVFFYVCIFYVFNISVRDVVNDGRFLFFFSNTLIMILAADYGVFASSSPKVVDVYESYGKVPVPCNEPVKLPVVSYAGRANDTKELRVAETDLLNEEECFVDAPLVQARGEEVKLLTYHDASSWDDIGADDHEEELEVVVEEDERVTEKREEEEEEEDKDEEEDEVEDDEYSRMSDEELNKRVEEFIWRLKTQIQQQEATDTD